jgi:hypothetical protein
MIGTRCQSNLRRLWSSHRTATPLRGITPRDLTFELTPLLPIFGFCPSDDNWM